MERIVQLIKQYWSILSYLFFGVVTTAVNMGVYYVCYHLCGLSSDGSTILAWVIAVLTAFLTNKPFVFGSHDWSMKVLLPEAKPSLLVGAAIAVTTILGYTPLATLVGGGGLGAIAVQYGLYRFRPAIMYVASIVLIVLVQVLQSVGMKLAKKTDKRIRI